MKYLDLKKNVYFTSNSKNRIKTFDFETFLDITQKTKKQ